MNTHKIKQLRWARLRAVLLSKHALTSAVVLAALPLAAHADEDCCVPTHDLNSFSFSARLGFNISARFKNPGHIAFSNTRKTPDGLNFNYDDGYVLTDFSDNAGGYTYNWGFDNASQVNSPGTPNNQLALSRTTSADRMASPFQDADTAIGGELVYRREIGVVPKLHHLRWGFEVAGSLVNFSINDHRSFNGQVTRQTDTYVPYPDSTITDPRQGTFNGPGQLLSDTPISTTFGSAPATISGNRKIDTDMWGFRVGPYAELPVAKHLNLSLSGGFAGALLDVDASWDETLSVGSSQYRFSGSGNNSAWRMGYYVSGGADYQFADNWSLVGSVQFQSLADYEHAISGRTVDIDLSKTIFVTLGLSYHF
ncbi:MAG: outer membrane protein [Limisphaerales bacterium]